MSAAQAAEIFQRSDAFADLNALNARDGDDIARNHGFRFIALESPEVYSLVFWLR